MALRNAFEDLATESTANAILVDQITLQRELLQKILVELKIMNTHLSLMTDDEIDADDLDLDIGEQV